MHKILICGHLTSRQECLELFSGVAEVIWLDSVDRAMFLEDIKPGHKYGDIDCLYHQNISIDHIGKFDKEIIDALPGSLKWIAHRGAGYDKVDVDACKQRGIIVSNSPNAADDATATTALYLLISALRQFSKAERDIRAGKWKRDLQSSGAHDATGKTLAILGLGGIGLRFAQLVHAFPMRVIYHNRRKVEDAPAWCEYFGEDRFEEMLAQADILSVHVPLNDDTVGLVGERAIRTLRKGAILINTARGKVVDEAAMIQALEDGHLSAIGLDVYPEEPEVNPRLYELANATLLPHVGANTIDTQKKMEMRALTNIYDYITKGRGVDVVPEMHSI